VVGFELWRRVFTRKQTIEPRSVFIFNSRQRTLDVWSQEAERRRGGGGEERRRGGEGSTAGQVGDKRPFSDGRV